MSVREEERIFHYHRCRCGVVLECECQLPQPEEVKGCLACTLN